MRPHRRSDGGRRLKNPPPQRRRRSRRILALPRTRPRALHTFRAEARFVPVAQHAHTGEEMKPNRREQFLPNPADFHVADQLVERRFVDHRRLAHRRAGEQFAPR